MIVYKNDFRSCTDGNQPYSIIPEATHRYSSNDGEVRGNVFYLK